MAQALIRYGSHRALLIVVAVLVMFSAIAHAQDNWTLIDDFEGRPVHWTAESGPGTNVKVSSGKAHSGKHSLAVTLSKQTEIMVRATWQVDMSDLKLTPDSRLRLWIFGNHLAQKPHGGLILVEAGGRKDGGDSHWMADVPAEGYSQEEWQLVTLPPIRDFKQPGWSVDADGNLEPERISKLLFVAQQESATELARPFTFYFDDLEATNVSEVKPVLVAASNDSKPDRIRPRIRGFIDRKRAHPAQVTFGDVSDWEVYQYGGIQATFVRSEEEPLFDKDTAKLIYSSRDGSGWIALRPKQPIQLPPRVNAIQTWVFGNNWDWVPDPTTPQPEIAVTVRDASGQNHRFTLGRVNWKFWGLFHKLLFEDPNKDNTHIAWGGDSDGKISPPAVFTGIEIRNCGNTDPRVLYFDSISFYEEKPAVMTYKPIPRKLPFPTTPDTLLPSVLETVRNAVTREGDTYVLSCRGKGDTIQYRYTPHTGTLSDLLCTVGSVSLKPADGGGPSWQVAGEELPPTDARIQRTLLSSRVEGKAVITRWRWKFEKKTVQFDLTLRVKGKSLLHEWNCAARSLTGLRLGHASGLVKGKVFRVPYYTVMGAGGAGVLLDRGLFASHLIDWYVTNSSGFYGNVQENSAQEIAFAGGSFYNPKTDGARNPLHERCFLTVSPHFEEVLPNIPNPPTPLTDILRNHLYTHLGGTAPNRFDLWLKQLQEYRKYGIDRLLVTQHEDSWTEGADVGQGPQEYTMTLEGPPDVGGDAKMHEYYDGVKALGYFVGPYNNYTDYSPLGKSWAEENVTRLPSGEWQRVWPPCFNIRPLKAVEMAACYAPAQVKKFGVNTTYCDVHTCIPPWADEDYDAGHPGAGKMRTTFEAYGRLLMLQRESYGGPAFSEGTHHCFYAGLIDGSYAQMGLPDPPSQPLLLDFDLRKIHPLSADISMHPWAYWGGNEYHCMAATIAYGHIGFFPFTDIAQSCRYFYLMQAMQRQYVQVPVREIGYWDGKEFLDTSHALPVEANKRGQVRVRYANGLEVYVNYSDGDRWRITVDDRTHDLAPYGWVARNGKEFLEYSTEAEGRRINFVQSKEFLFADAGGKFFDFGPIATEGEVVLKNEGPTGKRLILISPAKTLHLDGAFRKCTARDKDDKVLTEATLTQDDRGRAVIQPVSGALYYDLQ